MVYYTYLQWFRMRTQLSIVIPVYNESGNIAPFGEEVISHASHLGIGYEIIFVNDGSRDSTQNELIALQKKHPKIISVVEFRTNLGKAAAYMSGFAQSAGERIITLDGDGQDDPAEIPRLLATLDNGFELVVGWKKDRRDSFIKNITSKFFNAVTGCISPVKLHDYNCGLKAYTKEAANDLSLYGELHRYIPVLLSRRGYAVTEMPVHHRKRISGKSKYGPIRFINGFLDLFTVVSLTQFRSRPMHLFGYIGSLFFGAGFLAGAYLTFIKFIFGQSIGDRPLLLFSVMLMIMGVQIGISGLLGEYLVVSSHNKDMSPDIKAHIMHD